MSTYVAEFYNTSLIRPLQIKADYSRKFICFTFLIITFSNISFVRENAIFLEHRAFNEETISRHTNR